MELCSSVSKSLCAFSPPGPISQISRSPSFPLFVPKLIKVPSGETEYASALSRSFRGAAPPGTETSQTLLVCDDQEPGLSLAGWALATNTVLSGNHVPGISQLTSLPSSSFGWGMTRVSPVATSWARIPFALLYARYFPSGEIAPVSTRFSKELCVSCRPFNSRGGSPERSRTLPNQRTALTISSAAPPP